MTDRDPQRAEYDTVPNLIDMIQYVAEGISMEFDRWGEPYVTGPGLYFVIVADVHYGEYADPLGANTWPIDTCRVIPTTPDGFVEAARAVSRDRDGAVIVAADGTVQQQMVRITGPTNIDAITDDTIDYADWMGTKHLSAIEASVRDEVLAAITLSEENGRVTVFADGQYTDYKRHELGGRWRIETEG